MLLGIADRFRLLELFAKQQGGLAVMGIVRKLNEKVEFTIDELELHKIKQGPDGRVTWEIPFEREFEFSDKQIRFIGSVFEQAQIMTPAHLPLIEKFGVKIPEEE